LRIEKVQIIIPSVTFEGDIIMRANTISIDGFVRAIVVTLACILCIDYHTLTAAPEYIAAAKRTLQSDPVSMMQQHTQSSIPKTDQKVHDIGNIWLLISNYGFFGNINFDDFSQTCDHNGYIACQFPARSNWDYLCLGSIWIGGTAAGDTMVSCGFDGWAWEQELFPGFDDSDSIQVQSSRAGVSGYSPSAISEQDFIAVYTDTLLPPDYGNVSPDHTRPLGIEIIQNSYAWSYPYAEDFIIFDYWIRNLGYKELRNVYIALYLDADCGPTPYDYPSQHARAQDDITGFREYTDDSILVNIAWIADYEGEPGGDKNDEALAPGVMGIRVVRAPNVAGASNRLDINYNWWLSDTNAEKDWGPGTCFPDGLCGSPMGDVNKYLIMSNWAGDPNDPDQLDTFREGRPIGAEDTRFLLSFGPFSISPDDSLPFTLGYLCGENFYRSGNKYDMDFTDLEINAKWVQFVYDNPMIDTDGDGFFGEDVGSDMRYIGDPDYPGPDSDGTERNGKLDPGEDTFMQYVREEERYGYNNGVLDEGDGVPDFNGPPPPPSPKMKVKLDDKSIILQWTNDPESFEDTFITVGDRKDFAGYRVYKSYTGVISEYTLLHDLPLGSSDLAAMQSPDTVIAGVDTTVYLYEYTLSPVMENWPIYVSVTSYDRGYEPLNLESLESSVNYNASLIFPSKSVSSASSTHPSVVPNPYWIDGNYAEMAWEDWENQGQSWTEFTRRIEFTNLPGRCTIRIFSMTGDLIDTVRNYENDTRESWNLLSKDIQSITSGIYLFAVEPQHGGDNYVGKFVVIK
jgi:hypothetical protein